ncbi:MAG: hypothetical protein AB7O39_06915 [Flavobacteriaceae bacterium]
MKAQMRIARVVMMTLVITIAAAGLFTKSAHAQAKDGPSSGAPKEDSAISAVAGSITTDSSTNPDADVSSETERAIGTAIGLLSAPEKARLEQECAEVSEDSQDLTKLELAVCDRANKAGE